VTACRDLVESLYEYVANELAPGRQDDLHRHVEVCPPCAALVDSYRITIGLARRLAPLPMPPECLARLQAVARASPGG